MSCGTTKTGTLGMLPVQLGAGDLRMLRVEAPWLVAGLTRSAAPRRPLRCSLAPCSQARSQRRRALRRGRASACITVAIAHLQPHATEAAAVCGRGCNHMQPTEAIRLRPYATTHRGAHIHILPRRTDLACTRRPVPRTAALRASEARWPAPACLYRLIRPPASSLHRRRRAASPTSRAFSYPALASALRLRPPGEVRYMQSKDMDDEE